jgi:hypothetical protein
MKQIPGKVRRSGGPRTPRGKAAASRNSIKSGAYSQSVRLEIEDTTDFERIKSAVFADLNPQTSVQKLLAHNVFRYFWLQYRLERYEKNTLDELIAKPMGVGDWILQIGHDYEQVFRSIDRLNDDVRELGIEHFKKVYLLAKKIRGLYPDHCPDLAAFKLNHPDAYELLKSNTKDPESLDQRIQLNKKSSLGETFWQEIFATLEQWAKYRIDAFKAEDRIYEAAKRTETSRIFNYLTSEGFNRSANDLARSLHRAMAEFYREKERYQREISATSHHAVTAHEKEAETSGSP